MKRLDSDKKKNKTNFGNEKRGRKQGSAAPISTFTKKMVRAINQLHDEGYAYDKIAEMAGIPYSTMAYYKNETNIKRNISKQTLNFLTVAVGININKDDANRIKEKLIASWRKRIASNVTETDMPVVAMDDKQDSILVYLKRISEDLKAIREKIKD